VTNQCVFHDTAFRRSGVCYELYDGTVKQVQERTFAVAEPGSSTPPAMLLWGAFLCRVIHGRVATVLLQRAVRAGVVTFYIEGLFSVNTWLVRFQVLLMQQSLS